ncbi:MAG: methionine ABC transporter ATP-binding protein [Thermodesulfobacteriota bacterium]
MIVARNIDKSFGDLHVLRGVDLRVNKGCIFGLAGRSGAGKSTMLRCINGLETYDCGSLQVDGVEVSSLRERDIREFRKNIGMVFQNFSLLERLTVYENVALPMRCWKHKTGHIDRKVRELVDLVGLSRKLGQKPRELSGGQKQRVAIARALSLAPRILLCDEATSALDPKTAQDILSLLRGINQQMGITIIMVTHQMSVLSSTCEEMAILEHGRPACTGPVRSIFAEQPQSLRNLLGECAAPVVTICLPADPGLAMQMAADLGIEVTIAGGRTADGLTMLRFSGDDYADVAGYINGRNLPWYPAPQAEPDLPIGALRHQGTRHESQGRRS